VKREKTERSAGHRFLVAGRCFRIAGRRQTPRPAKPQKPRHCWLNPESRIVFSGAKRRIL
jgi:hypothetical protein